MNILKSQEIVPKEICLCALFSAFDHFATLFSNPQLHILLDLHIRILAMYWPLTPKKWIVDSVMT